MMEPYINNAVLPYKMPKIMLITCLLLPLLALAAPEDELSVEANIQQMDTDHDGQVSMSEIKVYLQKKYGPEYKQTLLDKLEARAEAKSCGSPFSRPMH